MLKKSPNREIRRFRFHAGVRSILATGLLLSCLIVLNLLSMKLYHHGRYCEKGDARLPQRSVDALSNLHGIVEMVAIFERNHPFRAPAQRLLTEYEEASATFSSLRIRTQLLNANLDLAAVSDYMHRYPVSPNSILIIFGEQHITLDEFDLAGPISGQETAASFRGEKACTSSILQLLRPNDAILYFLTGHGELDLSSHNPITGGSFLQLNLARNGFRTRPLLLGNKGTIPEDCSVLVIAGPRTLLSQYEIERISAYLSRGGRLLFLVDSTYANGLDPLLALWGIEIAPLPSGAGLRKQISTVHYGEHPVTRRLANTMTVFSDPCLVQPAENAGVGISDRGDKPVVSALVYAADHENSIHGTIAVASELGIENRTKTPAMPRLVVVGDSDFISNALLQAGFEGNSLFLLSAVEWLTGHRQTISQPESGPALTQGISPAGGWRKLARVFCVYIPLGILLFGLVFWCPVLRFLQH